VSEVQTAVAAPDATRARALGASLLTPELIVFPVRHHSPACALQLRRLIAQKQPSVILVEGPRSFTPLIPLLAHAEAKMPLSVYTYAVHKRGAQESELRRAAYYPFCDYSPELVALREAHARGIAARFIDLDFAEQVPLEADRDEEETSLLDERHYRRSRYLRALARQLGCRDHEELWEHLFEVSALWRSPEEHITDVAAYCLLTRHDCSQEELAAEGTLEREAEMAWHIKEALRARREPGPLLAVMGGFHAVVMPELIAGPVARPTVRRESMSEESSALIRYSFERLDRLNGYSAGMTSPAWHQRVWEQTLRRDRAGFDPSARVREEAALTLLCEIATELRERHRLPLPLPALAAAYEQVLRLTGLRGRPAPLRDDVLDAVTSCFIKGEADGEGALVLAVARRLLTGSDTGKVPPGTATPPLVKDFEYRARRQRLRVGDAESHRAVLDIYRRPEHRITSRLLHGLTLLGVPFAVRTAGPDFVNGMGLDRLQESWEYSYTVVTEAALVEASVYGATVPLAVASRFSVTLDRLQEQGQGHDAKAAAALLAQACMMGLHDHVPRLLSALRAAVCTDASFESVVSATASIGLMWESREPLEARGIAELPALQQAAFERAIYLGRELRGAAGEGGAVVEALARLRELLVSEAGRHLDAELYWAMVSAMREHHGAAVIRGAAVGLLYGAGRMDEKEVGIAVEGHLNGLGEPREAVAFLRGLLQTAREAAWQQPEVLKVLDRLLHQWDEEAFVAVLPELRLAFAAMTPKETDRIAEAVARMHGLTDLGPLVRHDLSEADLQVHLALSRAVEEVLAEDGLAEWLTA
jgi:hypothetical protein